MNTPEERYRIFNEERERLINMSSEERFRIFQEMRAEEQKARLETLPEELPLFGMPRTQQFKLGATPHALGFKPTYKVLPEPSDIYQEPQQATILGFKPRGAELKEIAPEIPELRMPFQPGYKLKAEYERLITVQQEAKRLRDKYDPGDRFAAIVEGFLPTPSDYHPVGFNEAFPVHRLAGGLTRILLFSKMAALKGVSTGTAEFTKEAIVPWLFEKSVTTPVVSQLMNHDTVATVASTLMHNSWFPAVVGNAVERSLVWSADTFISTLGKTLSPKEALTKTAITAPFGAALGAVHVMPFGGISSPSEAGRIGMTKLFGEAIMEQSRSKVYEFGGHVLPVVLAGGIGGARAALTDYWEQGYKFKKSALKEAMLAAAWTGFIEAVGHKHLVDEWKKYNLEQYLWNKADAFASSEVLRPDNTMSREALKVLHYNNFRLQMSPAAHDKLVYSTVLNETIPRQFHFMQPEQLSKIQGEFANRVIGGENAVDAFGDIVSQLFHAIKHVDMPISEVETPGLVLPSKYRTDFAEMLRTQIREFEKVPLHPAGEGKEAYKKAKQAIMKKYPEYDIEKILDEAKAKLPPKYETPFAEALQRRLKLSEAVPLHPSEIGRDAERVADEIFKTEFGQQAIKQVSEPSVSSAMDMISFGAQEGFTKVQKEFFVNELMKARENIIKSTSMASEEIKEITIPYLTDTDAKNLEKIFRGRYRYKEKKVSKKDYEKYEKMGLIKITRNTDGTFLDVEPTQKGEVAYAPKRFPQNFLGQEKYVYIKIPGDGEFRIYNNINAIDTVLKALKVRTVSPKEEIPQRPIEAAKTEKWFPFATKEAAPPSKLPFIQPKGKSGFQEYMEKVRAISAEPEAKAEIPEKPPELPERVKLRKHAFALQDQLEKMGYDKDFFNDVIKEGKSYASDRPNSMTQDEMKNSVRRMLKFLDSSVTTRRLTRKEQKKIMRDKAIRSKIFHKLPENPSVDLYHQVKDQFKDYKPETAHVFDWIRGVRHVFRRDRLLYKHGYKPLHDDAMVMEHFIVDNIRPARNKAKDIGVNQGDRRAVTYHRMLKYYKMINPGKYGPIESPILTDKQAAWDDYLTETFEQLAGIFKPQNLLPFDMYLPILFDDTADDPEMEMLGTFYPEGVPKNIEAFFRKKRENKSLEDKIHDDSLVLLERYIRSGAKDYFLKEDVRRIRNDLLSDKHINESMRKMLQSYTERVLGYPSVMDEFVGQTFANAINFMGKPVGFRRDYTAHDLNNMAHTLINLTYMSTMGLRPMPVLKNLTQSLNTACDIGPTWMVSGMIDFLFKGWKEADQAGVLMEYAPELYREYEEEDNFDKLRDLMLIGFQTADKINRSIAYYAGLNKFDAFSKIFKNPQKLNKWLLSHHLDKVKRDEVMDAIKRGDMNVARHLFAEEIVARTQYLYNKYDSPLITRSSLGKMYYQFASWPENYIEMMVDWYRNKNYVAFLRAFAATMALGYIANTANKKWLKKFIYSMSPGAPLPLTEWKLHRYAVPPSLGPFENLLYITGDIHALINMQSDPEKFKQRINKDLKRLMLNTLNWTPGGLLAKDIYKWSNIPSMQTGMPYSNRQVGIR